MGVIFTYVDQLTDFWVMKTYFENENTRSSFYAMLLIFVFHLLQDLFWIRMWKRQNPESMKRDIWLRIFMIKPIYDLYKIFMDYPTDHGCLVDPLQEFVNTKQTEVIYECVPQSIIQGLALFKPNLENRKSQVISLAITVVSTGFNQAVSSIITDTDPRKRKKNKSSGYVGNSSFARTSAFCMLTVFTSIYNLLRVASYLLLINALGPMSVLVVLVEYILSLVALYLIKGDFYCWWPVSGKFSGEKLRGRSQNYAELIANHCYVILILFRFARRSCAGANGEASGFFRHQFRAIHRAQAAVGQRGFLLDDVHHVGTMLQLLVRFVRFPCQG